MRRLGFFALLTAAVLAGCSRATPEQRVVNDAAAALGGNDRVAAAKTLVIEGEGAQGNLGQDMTPEAASQEFKVTEYKRSIDVAGKRVKTELTRDCLQFHGNLRAVECGEEELPNPARQRGGRHGR